MDEEAAARLAALAPARIGSAQDPTSAFLEAVADGPLDDPGYVLAAIRLAFALGLEDAPAIANTLEILVNTPEPDWTGDEDR